MRTNGATRQSAEGMRPPIRWTAKYLLKFSPIKGLKLLVNGTEETFFMASASDIDLSINNGVIYKEGNSLIVVLASGWSFEIQPTPNGFLHMIPAAPASAAGNIMGLFGTFNGNQQDEFTLPNGTVLFDNITDPEIYTDFGQEWGVAEEDSFFTYPAGKSWSDYQFPDFIPEYIPCEQRNLVAEAASVCDGVRTCMFDYCITRNRELAQNTGKSETNLKEQVSVLDNTTPEISGPSVVTATVGDRVEFTLWAIDTDGDAVTLQMSEEIPRAVLDPNTGSFSLTINDLTPTALGFIAEDARGGSSPILSVLLIVCSGCSAPNGQCDFGNYELDGTVTSFAVARCNCKSGYFGDDCSQEKDGCAGDPCSSLGTACTDLSPEQEASGLFSLPYRCECPSGYREITGVCVDINECESVSSNDCDQLCVNTEGSYTCSCYQGYRKVNDVCTDIDECAEGSHECQQRCSNTVPGFQCQCFPGYLLDPDGKSCSIDPSITCNITCEHFCVVENGTAECRCRAGFTLNLDLASCSDINECASPSTHTCSHACINTDGGYSCACPVGYTVGDDKRTCQQCDKRHWGIDCQGQCNCGTHVTRCDHVRGCVHCLPGWTDYNCETDIDECTMQAGAICTSPVENCTNTLGGYRCDCIPGYARDDTSLCVKRPTTLLLRLQTLYRSQYEDLQHPTTSAFLAPITTGLTDIFDESPYFKRLQYFGITEGGVVLEFSMVQSEGADYLDWLQTALLLLNHVVVNNNRFLTGRSMTYDVTLPIYVRLSNFTEFPLTNSCTVLEALGGCLNGGFCDSNNQTVECMCPEGYIGDICERTLDTRQDLAVIIASAVAAGIMLIIAFVAVCCYCVLRRRYRSSRASSERMLDDVASSVSTNAPSLSTSFHTRFVPAYKGWWPQGYDVGRWVSKSEEASGGVSWQEHPRPRAEPIDGGKNMKKRYQKRGRRERSEPDPSRKQKLHRRGGSERGWRGWLSSLRGTPREEPSYRAQNMVFDYAQPGPSKGYQGLYKQKEPLRPHKERHYGDRSEVSESVQSAHCELGSESGRSADPQSTLSFRARAWHAHSLGQGPPGGWTAASYVGGLGARQLGQWTQGAWMEASPQDSAAWMLDQEDQEHDWVEAPAPNQANYYYF